MIGKVRQNQNLKIISSTLTLKFFRKMKEKKGDMNEIEQQLQSDDWGDLALGFCLLVNKFTLEFDHIWIVHEFQFVESPQLFDALTALSLNIFR